ncbi:hypothetical protein ASG36_07300 [Geodermatophilus sp. Leaf369]|uniref:hypothetical protein n=1 Tax=Geodermatophilus sp. Leaf369 TaxID=1736354 RepID=UPI0006F7CBB5|nr:hypothetical protein [Geodermatophilus sp. Leaf369]KQS60684.1 hypothetical protein ASG36_07300 [Geodermatophilus sp. Leaf369]QNG37231.1 hypothetical protein F1C76_12105 [Geodermatophilaceae bacterium NBWT11]
MIVEVLGPDDVRVVDVDDLTRLHLALGVVDAAEADAALRAAGLGRLDGPDDAVLDTAALRAAAQLPDTDPGWVGMLRYAEQHGWLVEDGAGIRVHVESAAG